MSKPSQSEQLLEDWESIFRRGLLTFWSFVAIADEPADIEGIRARVSELTRGAWTPTDQALYRQFRRHLDLDLVEQTMVPSRNGPPRKLYGLSADGRALLSRFVQRNIALFDQPAVRKISLGSDV